MKIFSPLLFIIPSIIFSVNSVNSACIKGDCQNGYGIWVYKDGSRYEGEWNNGNYSGSGRLTRPNAVGLEKPPQEVPGEWWGKNGIRKADIENVRSPDETSAELSTPAAPVQSVQKNPPFNQISPADTTIRRQDTRADSHQKEVRVEAKPARGLFDFLKWPAARETEQPVSPKEKKQRKNIIAIDKKTAAFFSTARKGECVEGNCFDGNGTWRYPNGASYTGPWKNGLYHGRGTLLHPDGRRITREFKNGEAAW